LRTSLFLLDPKGEDRSFLVTSTLAGEGKTFCTVNYAISLARQGLRTLVIDCDLRRPVLEEVIWGERKNRPGVADYLNGGELTVHETRIENLYFVPAGTADANASELLARVGLQELTGESPAATYRRRQRSAPNPHDPVNLRRAFSSNSCKPTRASSSDALASAVPAGTKNRDSRFWSHGR